MTDNIKRMPSANNIHGLINRLNAILEDIEEVYVVVRKKDGFIEENIIGDMKGLAFAILVLQKHAFDQMELQQHGQD